MAPVGIKSPSVGIPFCTLCENPRAAGIDKGGVVPRIVRSAETQSVTSGPADDNGRRDGRPNGSLPDKAVMLPRPQAQEDHQPCGGQYPGEPVHQERALCSPGTRFRSPAREESVRLRVFRRIGTFLCKHGRQFLRLLMGMFAPASWARGTEQRHHPAPRS